MDTMGRRTDDGDVRIYVGLPCNHIDLLKDPP